MANYSVPATDVGKHEISMTAGVESVVTFEPSRSVESVEVIVLASDAPVYFTVDGSTATVKGGNCHVAFAGANSVQRRQNNLNGAVVHLITSGTATVSVVAL